MKIAGLKALFGIFVFLLTLTLATPAAVDKSCPHWLEFWVCAIIAYAVGYGEGVQTSGK